MLFKFYNGADIELVALDYGHWTEEFAKGTRREGDKVEVSLSDTKDTNKDISKDALRFN